jgi:hypothetical protein
MNHIMSLDKIQRVAVIDDDEQAREAMAESIVDANLQPVVQRTCLNSLDELINKLPRDADAALCDHRLTPRNYAAFQGAEAVAALYQISFPALLVTAWSTEDIDNIRPYRRKIPVLIKSGGLEPAIIRGGITVCLNEFNNIFLRERKPQRALLRIEDTDSSFAYVIVPSWDPDTGLKLPLTLFPEHLGHIKPGLRFFAIVNIGALKNEDLFFDGFEIAEEPGNSYADLIRP